MWVLTRLKMNEWWGLPPMLGIAPQQQKEILNRMRSALAACVHTTDGCVGHCSAALMCAAEVRGTIAVKSDCAGTVTWHAVV
jgi:hypothetical protein